ncbi:MAG: hypothetical protein H5U08_13470, partial [Thermogutta sp.]|nr:hypothetical protein [Thermogutta sp.]
ILFIDHLEPSELLDLRGYVEKWEDEYMSAVSEGAEEPEDKVLNRLRELEALRT